MRFLIDLAAGDPRYGLAVDEAIFNSVRRGAVDAVRFWVNRRSAIVGRSQHVEDEVDTVFAERSGIPILRRITGGGAVYHYAGNLNVSVVVGDARAVGSVGAAFRAFGAAISEGLSEIGPLVSFVDNDLRIGADKVGGAAQARRGSALLYHTTVLVRPAEISMERILLALRSGYRAAGVASRPRKTITLCEEDGRDLSMERVTAYLAPALADVLGVRLDRAEMTAAERADAKRLAEAKYGEPRWNRSAQMTVR